MKYYTVKRPKNIDIKSLFTEYCEERYLPFLKKSDNKELKRKLSKIEDEQEAIKDFIDSNLSRIFVFLDLHYDSRMNYDSEYHKFAGMDIGFVEQSAIDQRKYLSKLFRTFLRDFLIESHLLQCDGIYISPNATNTTETKSYGYRLHPRLYSNEHPWESYRLRITKRYYNTFTNKKYSETKQHYTGTVQAIKEMMERWKIDSKSVPEKYRDNLEQYLEQKSNGKFKEGKAKRIYAPETNLKSELRKYLYVESTFEEYQIVDISNSHHYLFSCLLLRNLNLSDQQINELDLLGQLLFNLSQKHKEVLINILSPLVSKWHEDNIDFASIWKEITNYRKELNKLDSEILISLFNGHSKRDYIVYILLAQSGLIYEVLMQYNEDFESRDEFKTWFTAMLNFKNEQLQKNFGIQKFFKTYFSDIFDYLIKLKKNSYKNFNLQMNKLERKLMLKNISRKLLDDDQYFINLHDGIMIRKKIAFNVMTDIQNTSKEMFGLTAPVKIEELA